MANRRVKYPLPAPMSATVSVGFRSSAITTSCGFCQESRCGSSKTRAYSSELGGWCWCATCATPATATAAISKILFIASLFPRFFRRLEPIQQIGIARELLQHRDSRRRSKPRPHQSAIRPRHLLFVLEEILLGCHAELAPHEVFGQSLLADVLIHFPNGLLRHRRRHSPPRQVRQHARLAQTFVFQARRGKALRELPIVEVAVFLQARDGGVHVGGALGLATQLLAQMARRVRPAGQHSQCVFPQRGGIQTRAFSLFHTAGFLMV